MITFITSNRVLEEYVIKKCKLEGVDFKIITSVVDLFHNYKRVKYSTVVIDLCGLKFRNVINELSRATHRLRKALKISSEYFNQNEIITKSEYLDKILAKAFKLDAKTRIINLLDAEEERMKETR